MREIKFRGFYTKDKTMIDWGTLRQTAFNRDGTSLMYDFLTGRTECEIMQYTGLKDKNGVEIYEGDIIEKNHGTRYLVKFEHGGFGVDGFLWSYLNDFLCDFDVFVIGNIHENPELLKG